MREIPFVKVSGSPEACGAQIGEALRADIHENVAAYMEVFTKGVGVSVDAVRKYAAEIVPVISDYAPDLLDEMRGLARGSNLDLGDIVALNARTEILYGLQNRPAAKKVDVGDECTSAGVLPEETVSGHTLIGQNWDWKAIVADRTAILGIDEPSRPRVIVFTEAGFVGKIGINEHGIGVLANLLISADDQGQMGVPYHVILRKVLAARHLHEATSAITLPQRGSSGNFLIGSAGGEVIDIEATPRGFDYLLTSDGIVTHSNHFLTPELRGRDMRRGGSALSMIRYDRARRLLRQDAGHIDEQSFMRMFRDHFGYPYSICRHVNPEDAPYDQVLSAASIVMDLEARTIWISGGTPCEEEYRRFELAAVMANS
ncbi:MAG: C45 family autoproteolytic acyltransferase/hydrolase [Thermaerobacter sp.]|nr:C45 family autoproteolytic acyltransferase/hydrolase [Thermaerobacter sp.]